MKIKRWHWLSCAMALTLGMVAWTAWRDNVSHASIAEVNINKKNDLAIQNSNSINAHNKVANLNRPIIDRDFLITSDSDPFKIVNFTPPPAVAIEAVAPPPPPKPTAPTFPYRYFGSMVDVEGKKLIYLQRGETYSAVHEHQILDDVYRVDSINATQIIVTYMPLEEKNIVMIQTAEN